MAKETIETLEDVEREMKGTNAALRWDCLLSRPDRYYIVTRRNTRNITVTEEVAKAWIAKHCEDHNVKKIHIGANSDLYVQFKI